MAKKRKKKSGKRSRRREVQQSRGGSMSSMRTGMRNLVGGDSSKPRERGSSFLTWLFVIILGIIVVMWMTR